MANAQDIINEISKFLDKCLHVKKFKIEKSDFLSFIEEKWASAGDEKYNIHNGCIIIGRMLNEYAWLKDYANMRRWFDMHDKHAISLKNPPYIINYYKGGLWLESGNEEEAFQYLKACYDENGEYIFTRGENCIKFFCERAGLPPPEKTEEENGDDEDFEGEIELKEWSAFFGEEDAIYYQLGEGDFSKRMRPRYEAALKYIEENQKAILEMILRELLRQYPTMQENFGYEGEDKEDFMPDAKKIKDFADLLTPASIHLIPVYIDNFPYIGYEFSCSWDGEHAFGVMTYKDNIVEIGGADTSFLTWIAEEDKRKARRREKVVQRSKK
ncbi:MAG: hypothetical protein LBS73_02480 [Campylobacteraceae bacterium]|jgi:hypothetical protein|nr:hypothetical protein [Campylobacteraceae bacterium]